MIYPGKAAAKDAARVGLFGLLLYPGVLLLARMFEHNATGALGAQFVLAEAGLGKLGVAWSNPHAKLATGREIAARALKGVRLGATVAAVALALGLASHALIREASEPSLSPLVLGALITAATAARDELLLRGLPIRLMVPVAPSLGRYGAAATLALIAAVAIAARAGGSDTTAGDLAFSGASAVALGGIWLRDRGAWMAFGAHAAFALLTGPLVRGGLIDLRASQGELVTRGPVLAVVVVAAAASAWWALKPPAADH